MMNVVYAAEVVVCKIAEPFVVAFGRLVLDGLVVGCKVSVSKTRYILANSSHPLEKFNRT